MKKELKCIYCELEYKISFSVDILDPEYCPFCGREVDLEQEEEEITE